MDIRSVRIKESIEKSGYSYADLEKVTGISKSSLQRYATGETKKIPIDCIEKIATATGTSAKYLMGWEENKNTNFIYNKIKELCDINGITISELCLITNTDINTITGFKKKRVPEQSLLELKSIADHFGVVTSYFIGMPDDIEMAKKLKKSETIGKFKVIDPQFKDQRVIDLAVQLDIMDQKDREYFLNAIESMLQLYFKMQEQIDAD